MSSGGDSRLVLSCVGDLMLGDSSMATGFGFRSRYASGSSIQKFEHLRGLLENSGLLFGNLETVLASTTWHESPWRGEQMRGTPKFASGLARAGFDVLNLANNHAMQHGPAAFQETVDELEANGISVCGLRGAPPWAAFPVVVVQSGVRVGFLGYSLRPRQYTKDTPLYAEGSREEIVADTSRLRSKVDHVVVSLHWGEEFVSAPSAEEVSLARDLVRAGCTAVVGHHPHVLRPVERLDGSIVAYSMGNFIGNMTWLESLRQTALLETGLGPNGIESVRLRGFRIASDFFPKPLSRANRSRSQVVTDPVVGLDKDDYEASARRQLTKYRLAIYWHALMNIWRYPPRVLCEILTATARNKAKGVTRLLNIGPDVNE